MRRDPNLGLADRQSVVDDFIEKYAKPRNRRWAETARTFEVNVIPAWGKRPIASIIRRDVIELLEKIDKERGPYMSNRTFAAIRRLFVGEHEPLKRP